MKRLFILCFIFFSVPLSASTSIGIKFGYGFFHPVIASGLDNDAIDDFNDDDGNSSSTSPNLGLQYQNNYSNKNSIGLTMLLYTGTEYIEEENSTYGYYAKREEQEVDYNLLEFDVVYSRKLTNWFIPFAGIKGITGFASSEIPVNEDEYPDGLPEGIPDSYDFSMIGAGPGIGIKTIFHIIGNFYWQMNAATGLVFSHYKYDFNNGTEGISANINFYLMNLSGGLVYYFSSLHTTVSIGVNSRTFRDISAGGFELLEHGLWDESQIVDVGLTFAINYIIL